MRVDYSQANKIHSGDIGGAKKTDRSNTAQPAKSNPNGASSTATQSSDARAEISGRAREFARAKEVAMAAPDVRSDRVAELKKKIAEGKYKVSAESIADRLVDEHIRTGDLG
jgi:negative regulator of flagellin synthesis FlgM